MHSLSVMTTKIRAKCSHVMILISNNNKKKHKKLEFSSNLTNITKTHVSNKTK